MPDINRKVLLGEGMYDGLRFRIISGKRLFNIDRFAIITAFQCLFIVQSWRSSDINRIHIGSEQIVDTAEPMRGRKFLGGAAGLFRVSAHNGMYTTVGYIAKSGSAFFSTTFPHPINPHFIFSGIDMFSCFSHLYFSNILS